jgi:PilZ domain-containing protein
MDERRIRNRQKSFLQGRIYYNNRRASLDCLVRDISPTGARLKFPGPVTAPEIVELYVPNKDEFYRAQVQWNHGDEIGVHFIRDEAENTPRAGGSLPEASLAERMQKLEAEVLALKRIIKDLKAERSGDAA